LWLCFTGQFGLSKYFEGKKKMTKENEKSQPEKEGYDFTGKDPNAVLTQDELVHFDDGMKLKNKSGPADQVDFARAARSVVQDLDRLLS
jgi:hypothetical protein